MPSSDPSPRVQAIALIAVAIIVAVMAFRLIRHEGGVPTARPTVVAQATPTQISAVPPAAPTPTLTPAQAAPAATPDRLKTFADFRLRPFAVTKSTGTDAWTAEDGRSPEAIRQLAHNELEVERLTKENSTINRRQLVYRSKPIAVDVQNARATGQPVKDFTLPGLDGQEYTVEVVQNNVEPVIAAGSLVGHLKGQPNSIASIGFKDGYESFNIMSPDDGVFIAADAREPGEVMVKSIIPGKYGGSKPTQEPDFILKKQE